MPIVPRLLPANSEVIASVLPYSLDVFFSEHFNNGMLRLNHTSTGLDVQRHLWERTDLHKNLAAMAADGKLQEGSNAIAVHGISSKGPTFKLPRLTPTAEQAAATIQEAMDNGTSFTLKFEYISAELRPLRWLSQGLFNLTGIPASVHLYCSAAGARVLKPHTDPYDVLVWQLSGKKAWRACVPRPGIGSGAYASGANLTDAQRCLLQELSRDSIKGCTPYTVDDTHSLQCEEFTMAPGDVLYMPKGVVHYAVTHNATEAFHLTIGLHRDNMQWLDVFYHLLAFDEAGESELKGAQQRRRVQPERVQHSRRRMSVELMEIYSETADGVHLHEFVPGWLLACRRKWAAGGMPSDGGDSGANSKHCTEQDAELRRLFSLHLERFGRWAYEHARRGPWKLALQIAEREKPAGDQTDLDAVSNLFWWDGDLGFTHRLAPSAKRFARALDWVAEVVDYHDTTKPRWARRTKGGGTAGGMRSFGEPVAAGRQTLCDEMKGWQVECKGSDTNHCEASVVNNTSCQSWCEQQGAWCEAAWDDSREGSSQRQAAGGGTACTTVRSSQICRCRRDCVDEGPWQCHEEGCPSRVVTCAILSVACRARFGDVWRKPPPGMAGMKISQACPMSCQACSCPNERAHVLALKVPPFVSAKPSTAVRDQYG